MTITYPLSLPAVTGVRSVTLAGRSRVAVSADPFVGSQQVYEWPGQWWEAQVALPAMTRAQAEDWIGFLLSLKGRKGTFHLGDPAGATPRGVATGTPLVDGAVAANATALPIKGFSNSVTGILKRGDWLSVGSGAAKRLHKVLADANSDGSGKATVDIFPSIREALADGAAITLASAQGTFRLADNLTAWDISEARIYGLSFAAIEAI